MIKSNVVSDIYEQVRANIFTNEQVHDKTKCCT